MVPVRSFLLFAAIIVGHTAHAVDACTVTTPTGTGIASRIRIVKISDDRKIIIIGQNHGDRLELRKLKDFVNNKSDSNDLWLWTMESILKSNSKAIQNASEEVVYIADLLRKDASVKFVGLEMVDGTLPDHIRYSEKFRDDLNNELSRRKISRQRESFLVGFAGSVSYLKMIEPGLMKGRTLFGMEEKKEDEAHEKALAKYDLTLRDLKQEINWSSKEGQGFAEKVNETEGELLALYPSYTPNLDEKILQSALRKTPERYKKHVLNWITASLDEMKAMKKRDEKIAEAMFAKDGSVIGTMGLAHLEFVTSRLLDLCKTGIEPIKSISNPKSPKGAR